MPLPSPRRAQAARQHRVVLVVCGGRQRSAVSPPSPRRRAPLQGCQVLAGRRAEDLVLRCNPRRLRLIGIRQLAEREVLGKSRRGQALCGAREQREERPAGRMRAARAAIEPAADAGALERVLEQAVVVLRRADEDGHLVERHARARFAQNTAGDLDALASLARRREELERAIQLARLRSLVRKETGAQVIEVGATRAGHVVDATTAPLERQPRGLVMSRNSRQDLARHCDQRADERFLHRRVDRQVHQQQRRAQKGFAGNARGGRREQRGAVGCRCVRQLGFRLMRQRREVVSGTTGVDQRRGRNASQANIGQRARERAREPRRSSDDAEVVERAGFRCVERDTAGNGFDAQRGARGNAFAAPDALPQRGRQAASG